MPANTASKQTASHTPAPWSVRDNNYIVGPDGFGLASAYSGNGVQDNVLPAEANARLIAAAPDLLTILGDFIAQELIHRRQSALLHRARLLRDRVEGR